MIELDGTQNKGRLGANAILSVSMAACKAAAMSTAPSKSAVSAAAPTTSTVLSSTLSCRNGSC